MNDGEHVGDCPLDQKESADWEKCLPVGLFKIFKKTPKEIFGTEPDEKTKRHVLYVATYLDPFMTVLQKRLKIDRELAWDLATDFIESLFASPAIRENVWGRYRYYATQSLIRFSIRKIKAMEKERKLELNFIQRVMIMTESLTDFAQDHILNIELRQIRKALESGLIEDFLNHGHKSGELTALDLAIWHLTCNCQLSKREITACGEIAKYNKHVTVDTVKNTLRKVEKYFARHAKELRLALRNL